MRFFVKVFVALDFLLFLFVQVGPDRFEQFISGFQLVQLDLLVFQVNRELPRVSLRFGQFGQALFEAFDPLRQLVFDSG